MEPTGHSQASLTPHELHVEEGADFVEGVGTGLRIAEIAVVTLLGLLVCPPLLLLAFLVAAPAVAVAALVAAVAAAIAVPTILVRRVVAHHRAHGSTLFLHRLRA